MKKSMILWLIGLAVLSGCPSESSNQGSEAKREMKVSIGVPETHFEYKAMALFETHIEENIAGMDVIIYPANSLAVDKEALEMIQFGTVQMNLPSPAVLANFSESFNLLALPFLFDDQAMADAITSGPWGQKLLATLEGSGFKGLGFGDFGFRNVTNSVKPIRTPADIQNLKIRTMQNPAHLAYFRAIGANPTPMDFSEVFSSLSQGTIDGQENPLKNIESNRLYEVQPYITMTGHVYSWVVMIVGEEFYNSLAAEEQAIIDAATDMAIESMRGAVVSEDAEARKVMEDFGIEFVDLSPAEKEAFRLAGQQAIDASGEGADLALYQELKQALADYRAQQ